ncbi:biopolymer transporter ExbD [Gammaproteobacteria bacterium]|nr:biopolymer transporter ExbD [Gammaproteobacteria bacterium]
MANMIPDRDEPMPSISLTALIDVVFLLLIFFMVTTTFTEQANIEIALPESQTANAENEQRRIVVVIDAQGAVSVQAPGAQGFKRLSNGSVAAVSQALGDAARGQTLPVVIRADKASNHEAMIRVLDGARRAGLAQIAFATFTGGADGQ